MSTVDMPEVLNFLSISQSVQVIHADEPQWLLEALNKAVETMVAKSVRYRKCSSISLEIKFQPGQLNQMMIEASLKTKEPQPDTLPVKAFTDSRGRLFGDDPMQTRLPLHNTVDMRRNNE